ncbi:hypothetical protein [Streptomyces sp. NPDC058595]|uniref:hypothetical protein n=1 Tax=Streptomyces sp. NPDC058595 TaxID=3346550 RepID=UPI003652C197
MPSARTPGTERPTRTRTARTNRRPVLAVSTIPAQELNLRANEMSLVCRDCRTWCPITGLQTPKLSPHPRPKTQGSHRCPGSNQLLDLDVDIDTWREQLLAVEATATYRRAPRQHFKPLAQPPTPIHRLAAREQAAPTVVRLAPLLEQARHAVLQHRAICSVCRTGGRCATGKELEIRRGETHGSVTFAREQQGLADRLAAQRARAARPDPARMRQTLLKADHAARQRHNVHVPAGSTTTLVDEHERIRRAVTWPAPTHGGPDLPHTHLTV